MNITTKQVCDLSKISFDDEFYDVFPTNPQEQQTQNVNIFISNKNKNKNGKMENWKIGLRLFALICLLIIYKSSDLFS